MGRPALLCKFAPIGLPLFLILQPPPAPAAPRDKIGFVLEMNGEWLADGNPLRQGQAVEAGAVIALSPRTRFDSGDLWKITIILLSNEPRTRSCATFDDCHTPLRLPPSLSQTSGPLSRIGDAIARLILNQPDRYASAIARGQESHGIALSDAVLRLDAGHLQIFGLLKDVPAMHLLLRFQRHMQPDDSDVRKIPLDWRPGQPAIVAAAGLTQGIYTLRLFDADRPQGQPVSEVAWVLLEPPSRYPASSSEFLQAANLTAGWQPQISDQDRRIFLRACLDRLARSTSTTTGAN